MDGGRNDNIEEGLCNGRKKVNIRGSMKEKAKGFFLYAIFLVFVTLKLLR